MYRVVRILKSGKKVYSRNFPDRDDAETELKSQKKSEARRGLRHYIEEVPEENNKA